MGQLARGTVSFRGRPGPDDGGARTADKTRHRSRRPRPASTARTRAAGLASATALPRCARRGRARTTARTGARTGAATRLAPGSLCRRRAADEQERRGSRPVHDIGGHRQLPTAIPPHVRRRSRRFGEPERRDERAVSQRCFQQPTWSHTASGHAPKASHRRRDERRSCPRHACAGRGGASTTSARYGVKRRMRDGLVAECAERAL